MSWHVEDWGSTLGTSGSLGFVQGTDSTWKAGYNIFYADPDAIRGTATNYTILAGNVATTPLVGSHTGSQYHCGSGTFNTYNTSTSRAMMHLSAYDGTRIFMSAGPTKVGRDILFYKTVGGGELTSLPGGIITTGGSQNIYWECSCAYNGSGTWSGSLTTYDAAGTSTITGSTTLQSVLGSYYPPLADATPYICYSTRFALARIYESRWEYEPPPPTPPTESILQFIGTWNNGAGSGTYNWGQDVIGAPGNVQDRAFGPLDSAGWASTVNVTLDDSTGQWGSFCGTTQEPFEGTWRMMRYWGGLGTGGATGSWVTLLTGFVEPDGLSYDYARRTAAITIQSSIARAAHSVASHHGTRWSTIANMSIPCYQQLVGECTYANPETGTIRVSRTSGYWQVEAGCRLWGTSGTDTTSVTVGSAITQAGLYTSAGTGTLVVDGEFPDWMTVGNEIWLTRPWPSYSDRTVEHDTWQYVEALGSGLGIDWTTADALVFSKQSAATPLSPNFRLYGGEKLTTALTGIMQACNGFFSVDPTGQFRARCNMPQSVVAGTVDFTTAYDSDWSIGYEPAHSGIEMDSSYNPETGSYTQHTSVGGTQSWGDIRELKLPWVGSGIEAESLAGRIYRNSYIPRPALTLRLAGSAWDGRAPGGLWALHNLPAHLQTVMGAGTEFVLYSRTHDWRDDLTALEFVTMPSGNYAVWDGTPADVWHESGKVWY